MWANTGTIMSVVWSCQLSVRHSHEFAHIFYTGTGNVIRVDMARFKDVVVFAC